MKIKNILAVGLTALVLLGAGCASDDHHQNKVAVETVRNNRLDGKGEDLYESTLATSIQINTNGIGATNMNQVEVVLSPQMAKFKLNMAAIRTSQPISGGGRRRSIAFPNGAVADPIGSATTTSSGPGGNNTVFHIPGAP